MSVADVLVAALLDLEVDEVYLCASIMLMLGVFIIMHVLVSQFWISCLVSPLPLFCVYVCMSLARAHRASFFCLLGWLRPISG